MWIHKSVVNVVIISHSEEKKCNLLSHNATGHLIPRENLYIALSVLQREEKNEISTCERRDMEMYSYVA